jgi:hypothetical protein
MSGLIDKTSPRHTIHGTTEACLGIGVLIMCPGCQSLHRPVFRCPEHGGPAEGPVWEGDPYSTPFSMEPSYKATWIEDGVEKVCHSFLRNGQWDFLEDCSAHKLRGLHPMIDLPHWVTREH